MIETAGNTSIPINYGATERYDDLANIDCTAQQGAVIVSLFRSTPPAYPFTLKVMENHPLGTQAFMPACPGGPIWRWWRRAAGSIPTAMRAFLAGGDQVARIRARGTWHHFNLALGAPSDFLVIDRGRAY